MVAARSRIWLLTRASISSIEAWTRGSSTRRRWLLCATLRAVSWRRRAARARSCSQDRHLNRRDTFKKNRCAALAEWRHLAA